MGNNYVSFILTNSQLLLRFNPINISTRRTNIRFIVIAQNLFAPKTFFYRFILYHIASSNIIPQAIPNINKK